MRMPHWTLRKAFSKVKACELCHSHQGIQTHHQPTWGAAHLDTRLTIIRLCFRCHTETHGTTRNATLIVDRICRREGCLWEDRIAVICLLKRAPKGTTRAWLFEQADGWSDSAKTLLTKTVGEASNRQWRNG